MPRVSGPSLAVPKPKLGTFHVRASRCPVSRAALSEMLTEMLFICSVQYGTHYSHVAIAHLKRGQGDGGTEFLIF